CADIGNPAPAGTQSLSGTTWTIKGGGSDIQGTADAFHYVWQTMAANGSLSADVTAQSASSAWAKAGVMVRLSSAAGSPYYAVFITPSYSVDVQWRAASGGGTSAFHTSTGAVPIYLQIVRSGTTFSAFTSSNGTTWTAVSGSTHSLSDLAGSLLEGLAVCSHTSSALSTVTMTSVITS
ncbi:MAG TPA: hypothetical protein VFA70_05050, partial [Dehalococcoidia bacterium]|nr:hypothetical protein [Dehalococcoidia bacterium]